MIGDIIEANPGLDFSNICRFRALTSKSFNNLEVLYKNCLYFIVDTGEIYKGGISFSSAIIKCDKFPTNPTNGKIYYNTVTKQICYYDSSEDKWVSLLTPMVDTLFDETVDYTTVTVTGAAIKEYLDYKIDEMYKSLGKEPGYNTTPIFATYDAALKYSQTNPAAKPGQCITAPSELDPDELVMYVIQNDKSLKEYPSMEQIKNLLKWRTY